MAAPRPRRWPSSSFSTGISPAPCTSACSAPEDSLLTITGSKPGTFRTLAEQRLGRLRSELDYGNIEEIIAGGIHEFVDAFQTRLNLVGEAIYESFFALPPVHDVPAKQSQKQSQSQSQSQTLAAGT